jgi:CheY-like chemotaxis protein
MARILIADDDPGAREMLSRICEFHGHEIESVADADKARTAYDAFEPDTVILDLSMPKGGGRAFLEGLRTSRPRHVCPVIVVSGYVDAIGEAELKGLGAFSVVRKPVEVQTMLDALGDALGTE